MNHLTLYFKEKKPFMGQGYGSVVEYLSSLCKALSSNPCITPTNKYKGPGTAVAFLEPTAIIYRRRSLRILEDLMSGTRDDCGKSN